VEQGTLNGLYFLILLLEIVYFAVSWDHIYNIMTNSSYTNESIYANGQLVIAFTRIPMMLLAAALLALMRCDPVGKEEQVRVFSSARPCATTWLSRVTCAAEAYALRPVRPSS
jgi:hypothetical protein